MSNSLSLLLVDDDTQILGLLDEFLTDQGHRVDCVTSVLEAMDRLRSSEDLDVVVCDIGLPDGSGMDILNCVLEQHPDRDLLFMSGQDSISKVQEAVSMGAAGYLDKPFDLADITKAIEDLARQREDRTHIVQLKSTLQTERVLRKRVEDDRQFARRMQRRLFPKGISWLKRTEVHLRHMPMAGLGGDYVDMRERGDGSALIFIADVSGHGTGAAFGAIALKAWFSTVPDDLSPGQVLSSADEIICDIFPEEFYATAWCAVYDEKVRSITYASAGHPPVLLLGPGEEAHSLDGYGPVLGIMGKGATREEHRSQVLCGQCLFTYTDGLGADVPILKERWQGLDPHLRSAEAGGNEIATGLLDACMETGPKKAFGDDISILVLKPRQPVLPTVNEVSLQGRRVGLVALTESPLAQRLEGLGLRVLATDDAAHDVDLVVVDVGALPQGARSLCRRARKHYPNVPMVVAARDDAEDVARNVLHRQPAGFLSHGMDNDALDRTLTKALTFDSGKDYLRFDELGGEWFDFMISSSPNAVELLGRYLEAIGRQPIPQEALNDVVWCVRELATNGIEWGNHFDHDLRVRVSTLVLQDRVMVRIADEGIGFDTHRLFEEQDILKDQDRRLEEGKRDGGFGLPAVRVRMNRVAFNEAGNVVLMVRKFSNALNDEDSGNISIPGPALEPKSP